MFPRWRSRYGSSPPTWGIPVPGGLVSRVQRFIPTYVGHTGSGRRPGWSGPVHPHLRGAYFIVFIRSGRHVGSSPPTWGIRPDPRSQSSFSRFIPTYVGHTAYLNSKEAAQYGSSPPTWGIPGYGTERQDATRFIPTYVGHTAFCSPSRGFTAVHPHLRGAYDTRGICTLSLNGSSPPTWGILA